MYAVILCGGTGTRLWPLSRKDFPKQFLSLYSDKSLLQETYLRMEKIIPRDHIFFITSKENYRHVSNQIKAVYPGLKKSRIMVEPMKSNTAPAIAYAIKYLEEKIKIEKKSPIIFLPSDHFIGKPTAYLNLVRKAMKEARSHIGTIGITPTKPETGYGYIKKGRKNAHGYNQVLEFKEKPSKEIAEKYLKSGQYVWNSGMYIFSSETFFKEIKKNAPEFYKFTKGGLDYLIRNFKKLPALSIDVALSEKSKNIIVFEGDFGWSDIGSFDSLADIISRRKIFQPRHVSIDSDNVFIHSPGGKLIVTVGVKDLVIVESGDSVLVQKKGRGEDIKKIVEYLDKKKYKELGK